MFKFVKDLKETTAKNIEQVKVLLLKEIDSKQANMIINMLDRNNQVTVVNNLGTNIFITKELGQ